MRFIRRLLNMLIVILFVSVLMFVLVRVLPGDPVGAALGEGATKEQVDKFRAQMGMDRPLQVQYAVYLKGLVDGHFGPSLIESRDVGDIVWERLPATLGAGALLAAVGDRARRPARHPRGHAPQRCHRSDQPPLLAHRCCFSRILGGLDAAIAARCGTGAAADHRPHLRGARPRI